MTGTDASKEYYKAVVLGSEINLTNIATHFGISRKLKWEDSLVLNASALQGIIRQPEEKIVYIFHFGGAVFINCAVHEINDITSYLKDVDKSVNVANILQYVDDYEVEVNPAEESAINNDYLIAHEYSDYQREIVATVLAKSVALEKIEVNVDRLLDEVEDVVENLRQGHLSASDTRLGQMSAKILGFKLNTISSIMLLDKPDITWVNENAAALFDELSRMFELTERYHNIRHKTEVLMDITGVFSNLAHAKRGARLEWAIIILIIIEICLSLFDMFIK